MAHVLIYKINSTIKGCFAITETLGQNFQFVDYAIAVNANFHCLLISFRSLMIENYRLRARGLPIHRLANRVGHEWRWWAWHLRPS